MPFATFATVPVCFGWIPLFAAADATGTAIKNNAIQPAMDKNVAKPDAGNNKGITLHMGDPAPTVSRIRTSQGNALI